MAEYHHPSMSGDLAHFLAHVDARITASSATANLEGTSDRWIGEARMAVRIYERYSATGANRLTLTFAVLASQGQLEVSAITSGGSTGLIWKINTFGESAFLDRAIDAITTFPTPGSAGTR